MQTTAILADRKGSILDGRFKLVSWLGGTAEGSVYLTETEGGGKAAVKLILAGSPGADARFAGWTAALRINHPHLLRVLHAGRSVLDGDGSEVFYAVTELADEVLAEILPDRPLTPDEAGDMLRPVLDALACLHGHGLIHGRLKPANILVVGESLKLSADCSPIATGKAPGSAADWSVYDAPELTRGVASPAADVWSLGMTITAALTQRTPPWDREEGFEPVVRPALPAPFESIVRDCLRLEPSSRLALPEITARLEGEEGTAGAPAALDPNFNPAIAAHSSRWVPAWIGGAVILGIAVTALILHNRPSPPAPDSTSITDQQPASAAQPDTATSSQAAPAQSPAAQKPSATRASHALPPAAHATAPASQREAENAQPPASTGNGAIVKRVMPDVLPAARASIRGTITIHVRVQVDATGAVTDATSESPQASRYFNRIAVQAAQGWQFAPAQAAGAAAPSAWMLHFQFRGDGTHVTADRLAQ
jgi:eukaryotic-like serine/threonine-protein kinase